MSKRITDGELEILIARVHDGFKKIREHRLDLIISLGEKLAECREDKHQVCQEIKDILRPEMAEGLVSAKYIEQISKMEWKQTDKSEAGLKGAQSKKRKANTENPAAALRHENPQESSSKEEAAVGTTGGEMTAPGNIEHNTREIPPVTARTGRTPDEPERSPWELVFFIKRGSPWQIKINGAANMGEKLYLHHNGSEVTEVLTARESAQVR